LLDVSLLKINIELKKHDCRIFQLIWQTQRAIPTPTISRLKNVFWPNIFVGAPLKILNIQQYASGLKLGPAAILNQNPIFETASNESIISTYLFGFQHQFLALPCEYGKW